VGRVEIEHGTDPGSACAAPDDRVVHHVGVVLKIGQQISVAVNRAASVGVPPR
jgi:hypothetical protein